VDVAIDDTREHLAGRARRAAHGDGIVLAWPAFHRVPVAPPGPRVSHHLAMEARRRLATARPPAAPDATRVMPSDAG
jgi:hypothetical protein